MGSESMTHVHSHRTLAERSAVLRHQNDNARRYARAGLLYVTAGVIALGAAQMTAAVRAIREFEGFNADNDPHDEHDMGIVTVNGDVVLWKIDYYDHDRRGSSPDPTDLNVTTRVLTIMLASEY